MSDTFMKERPVLPLLTSMALPMVVSMLVNALYNIVDSFFVAKISEDAMTAISLVYPVQNFVNAVAIGYGVGINSLIAFYLGAQDQKHADTAATQGLVFSAIHGILLTVGSLWVMPSFLRMFTSDDTLIALGLEYSTIVLLFSCVITIDLAFEKMFQAVGRMKACMLSLLCGCIGNMILDPLMIFGIGIFPEMGIAGAAWATGIGQVLSLAVYLVLYAVRPLPVRVRRQYVRPHRRINLRLYGVGIPALLNLALPSLLISVLNGLLAVFSQSYVTVLGIYYKLQTLLYLPANGIVQGMRPIIGYNFGAGERERVKQIYTTALCMSAVIMALGTGVCLAVSGPLMGLFTDNPATISAGQTALQIISAGFIVSAVSITSSGALEGLGRGGHSLVISLCRYVVVMIPAAFLLCRRFGPLGVWNAFWITELVTAGIAFLVFRQAVREGANQAR